MRLREYQHLIKKAKLKIKLLSTEVVRNNMNLNGRANDLKILNLSDYNSAIDELLSANIFNKVISDIRKMQYFNRAENEIIVSENEYNNLKNLNQQLLLQMDNLTATLDNILSEENEESINIKLPEYKTFEEYNNLFKNLKTIFSTFDYLQITTDLNGFETGSKWINISFNKPNKEQVKTIALVISLFFNMANSSLDLRNKFLEGEKSIVNLKQFEMQIEENDRKKLIEMLGILQKTNNKAYDEYKEQIIEKLLINSGIEISEEEKNELKPRIGASIETMGKLLDEGMIITPAFNAPEETKAIFAQFNEKLEEHKKLMIGITSQKLIEQKEEMEKQEESENNKENINE